MANVKFSQFTSDTAPDANSFFVGYNSNTNANMRFSLAQLSAALGLSSYVTLATTQTISGTSYSLRQVPTMMCYMELRHKIFQP